MFYYELIHIHQDKSCKCWRHARRFGSHSACSRPRLYCISARPFAAAGHELEPGPGRGRLLVGGIEGQGGGGSWWACWQETFWLRAWWLPLQQPLPLPLFPTHPSRTLTLVPSPFVLASSARQFKFVIASRSESLHSRVFGPLALHQVGSWRCRAQWRCRGLQVRARLARLPNWTMLVAPVVSTLIQVMRSTGCRQRLPSVPTTTHRPLVVLKVWARLRSDLGPVPGTCCTVIS